MIKTQTREKWEGITPAGQFGARAGDSIVVTENGFKCLTPYPKQMKSL